MKTGCIKCMEKRIGDRSPVGRLSRTWLWIADMPEMEIDIYDRKIWRRNIMNRKSNPIGKWSIHQL